MVTARTSTTGLQHHGLAYLAVGTRVGLRIWHQRDRAHLQQWPAHDIPAHWTHSAPSDGLRIRYALDHLHEGGLIGRLTLRDLCVDSYGRSARLGIFLHPNHVGQGLGTEALQLFCRYDANLPNESLSVIRLDVASDNHRAIVCYHKAGFHIVDCSQRDGLGFLEMEYSHGGIDVPFSLC